LARTKALGPLLVCVIDAIGSSSPCAPFPNRAAQQEN